MANPANDGDRVLLSGRTFNRFDRAVDFVHGTRGRNSKGFSVPRKPRISIRNDTGTDVPNRGVIMVGDPVIVEADNLDEFLKDDYFDGLDPIDRLGDIVIADGPIADGKTGDCFSDGISAVQIDIRHATHDYAWPIADDFSKLQSSLWGPFRILWKPAGTGVEWCKVRFLGHIPDIEYAGVADGTIAAGSSGTVDLVDKGSATGWEETSVYLDHTEEPTPGGDIPTGADVFIKFFEAEDRVRVTGAEC